MATIASLFGRHAPFTELQSHMKVVQACASHVPDLLAAVVAEDKVNVEVVKGTSIAVAAGLVLFPPEPNLPSVELN